MSGQSHQTIGVVAIGRNEGDRLKQCLTAAVQQAGDPAAVVYVDSGSTDGSVAFARSLGARVIELDTAIPFTAARARNAGLAHLRQTTPGLAYVQFLDGDCELEPGYLGAAAQTLAANPQAAVVSGRRRERHREATLYNRLCDMEWDTPVGEVKACHGDATMRLSALDQVGGFDQTLIAGEEPELCVRLRSAGWRIVRVDLPMTVHDAAMTRFPQWWKRQVRAGHAAGEGAFMHGATPERHKAKEVRSALLWGAIWPMMFGVTLLLGLAWPWLWIFTAMLAALLGVLGWRVWRYRCKRGDPAGEAAMYAGMTVLGKIPTAIGVLKFHRNRLAGRRGTLIEYKGREGRSS